MTKQYVFWISVGCMAVVLGGVLGRHSAVGSAANPSPKERVFELRTYTTAPGRLPALHDRFRNHTMKLFEKHGMTNIVYCVPTDKPDTLVYLISHSSEQAAEKSWDGFRNDPDWQKAYRESRSDGPIVTKVVSQFLQPADYSPMK